MKKSDYEQYIKPADFLNIYREWQAVGKPLKNSSLYLKIWDGVQNAVKACIGSLQQKYRCTYTHYDEKVMDATILVVNALVRCKTEPRNIVTFSFLYTLGVCCGKDAIQLDYEDNALSIDAPTADDDFVDLMYYDEQGILRYNY